MTKISYIVICGTGLQASFETLAQVFTIRCYALDVDRVKGRHVFSRAAISQEANALALQKRSLIIASLKFHAARIT